MVTEAPFGHPDEWPVMRLAEITLKIGSGATPRGGAENYLPQRTGFALIRSQNVFDRYFDYSGLAFISDGQARELQNVVVQRGDLLLNITGDGVTFSRCCAAPNDVLPACVNQHVSIVRVDPSLADPGYVLDFLTHPIVKNYIESFNAGGSRRAITKGNIESFMLPLPPLAEQRVIAHVLGTLDEKIELNRKVSETLEAIVRALFKSWFVDFDPVRAKAEGCDTGLPDHIADFFPDSLAVSELGDVPSGWMPSSLGNILTIDKGVSYKGEYLGSGMPMVNLGCFLGKGRFNEAAVKPYSGEYKPRHMIHAGDLVVANTDITQKRDVLGSPAIVPPLPDTDALLFTHHVFALRLNSGAEHFKLFVYLLLLQDGFRERAMGFATGTTVLALPKDAILDLTYISPPDGLVAAFNRIATPLNEMKWRNAEESRRLVALRDSLLPKLISGQIRVDGMQGEG